MSAVQQPVAAPQDLDWLGNLLGAAAWSPLTPPAALRLSGILGGLRLESVLPLLEEASRQGRRQPVIALYRAWIAANPQSGQCFAGWFNLGVEYARAGETAEAALAYRQALALQPALWQASVNLGLALEASGQAEAALAVWEEALQPDEARVTLLNQRGRLLEERKHFVAAEATLRASLRIDAQQPDALQHWGHLRQKACIWPLHEPLLPGLAASEMALHAGPLGVLALTDDVAQQRRTVEAWLARKVPAAPARLSPAEGYRHERIRVGYLSSDFCRHAMSFLIVNLLERHDRGAFEVFGYCSSPEDGSDIRQRVLRALDHHVPIGQLDDAAAARRIREDEIDILVDLNGVTRGARLQCLRWKPAPVQVTYLGYVGPLPLPELDYILCDDHVIPPALAGQYAPRPLPLPGLYQANDSRMPALPALTRATEGLPDDAIVFCCMANHYKVTEDVFGAWMTILAQVPHAVLWLAEDTEDSRGNLLRRAAQRGVAPARLIFAPRVDPAHYLARLGLADLFLDTFPYNSGTVASDALRMGLPLLTLSGRAFASRMAGSLLRAIGLEETIAETMAAYVDKAVAAGTDPTLLARWRAVLAGDAWARTIGDSAAFTRGLEAVFRRIRLEPDLAADR
ncbi:O-linked N-acetylglucosamine transferase, SPINDLY family protein [Roseicella aquatilis]|uniref:protein O-GlcNAc transferase n=1 Tax=Roseicella aquatilis TaxID=2527868 RepID=A0A4R4D4T5_9PROT|nr:tetratricopeptide repeat protein [Roseicella aquatilis]TCZ52279.1 tetratricopeptide repeat protein [Roseicella aquatilis]